MHTDSDVASVISAQETIGGEFSETSRPGKTILLVEAEAFVRKATAEVLQSAGYNVVVARGAVEALDACGRGSQIVDLILSDFVMPGVSSCELVAEFNIRYPHAQILIISNSEAEVSSRHSSAYCKTHLAKPFSVLGLLKKVGEALGDIALESAIPV